MLKKIAKNRNNKTTRTRGTVTRKQKELVSCCLGGDDDDDDDDDDDGDGGVGDDDDDDDDNPSVHLSVRLKLWLSGHGSTSSSFLNNKIKT